VTDGGERPAPGEPRAAAGDDGPASDAAAAVRDALVDRLARYDRLLEVGVGRRTDVAGALAAAGKDVTAMDVHERQVPEGVAFVREDAVAASRRPDPGPAAGVDAVYALNLPAELQAPTATLARRVGADCLFTTLGFEEPAVPVRRESVGDETLYVAER